MCGIVACVTSKKSDFAADACFKGLEYLEYRGYDSAGISLIVDGKFETKKAVGKLESLKKEIKSKPFSKSNIAAGHTRWATHGSPSIENAHPHISTNGRVALVHNGIIENAAQIKSEKLQNIKLTGNTDTQIVAEYLSMLLEETGNLQNAMTKLVKQIDGSWAFVAMDVKDNSKIVCSRHNSPLVIGKGESENFIASDVIAFVEYTKNAVEIKQDQIAVIEWDNIKLFNFAGEQIDYANQEYKIDWNIDAAKKGGYSSFMEKEIREEPAAVRNTIYGRGSQDGRFGLDRLDFDENYLKLIDKITVVACGTAAHSGYVARFAIEHWCKIPVEVEFAHEFRYRDPIVNSKTLVIAISQSGETMDTLQAVRYAKQQGAKTLAIVNTLGSALDRECDAVLYTYAGREIAVASTKAFIAQITACYILGLYLAEVRGNLFLDEIESKIRELKTLPDKLAKVLQSYDDIKAFAKKEKNTESVLFLGRHIGYPIALEGALKLKEIAYIHSEGFAAGELKHGPIAIIEKGQLVFVIVPPKNDRAEVHSKVLANIEEIISRGGRIVVIAEEGDNSLSEKLEKGGIEKIFFRPKTSILFSAVLDIVPLQIFACSVALFKGLDIDMPRNLAKSVTVE
ncbi:MAG: glutamine--fructose-6-phosphate transaminase (isomerizing) [Bifidobacteriaceae bacterium]|jgi:glucosamine--fructose-6-phosphate aminotransferase (isomerizing)|nr:glutamine--fructose-6-phosphate transaminase (isomerizing) [Bifidobacteriaceae bacterium]